MEDKKINQENFPGFTTKKFFVWYVAPPEIKDQKPSGMTDEKRAEIRRMLGLKSQ